MNSRPPDGYLALAVGIAIVAVFASVWQAFDTMQGQDVDTTLVLVVLANLGVQLSLATAMLSAVIIGRNMLTVQPTPATGVAGPAESDTSV